MEDGVTGFVTAPRDPNELALRVEQLLDAVECREEMGQRAFSYAQNQGWEAVLDRLFAVYGEVSSRYRADAGPGLQDRSGQRGYGHPQKQRRGGSRLPSTRERSRTL